MRRLLNLAARFPYAVMGALLAVSLLAAWQVRELTVHISPQSLTIEDDPDRAFYERSIATFGSDNVTVLFFEDPDLFRPEYLAAIRQVVRRVEALPHVVRTQSLFSVPHLRVDDDYVIAKPFLEVIPQDPAQADAVVEAAMQNPFVRNNLLADQGTALAVNVYLDAQARRSPEADLAIVAGIEQALTPAAHFSRAFQIGVPYIRSAIKERINRDQHTIMPLAVGVLLVTLVFSLRRPNGAIIPLITAGLSVLWTLGFMAALNIPLNVMTAVVPVLLIIIGSTEDIHLIAEFYAGIREGYMRRRAVLYMARRMGLAVLLTFLTSALGFLSVATSPIHLVREFGLVAAFGLSINFAITVVFIPAYLSRFGDSRPTPRGRQPRIPGNGAVGFLARFALKRRILVATVTLLMTMGAVYFSKNIIINNNILNYFEQDSDVMDRVNTVHRHLSGLETFSVVLDGHIDGTFRKVRYLEQIAKIQGYLAAHPAFDFNVSFADFLGQLNSVANESGEAELPAEDNVVDALLLFLKHEDVASYVSPDFSKASIVVRHNIASSHELSAALQALREFISAQVDRDLEVEITGESILANNAADRMAEGQAQSLLIMLAVIFAVIGLLFFNAKAGLLAILPNLFLVTMLFGTMGYAGIPLDTGTAMIAALALGICVDHTMHFMVRYNSKLKQGVTEHEAVTATIRDEATPVSAASVALAAGLGTLTFSSFIPVVHFGALSALVMLLAFYANFFIMPILLSYTRLVTLWDVLSLRLRKALIQDCLLFQGMRPYQIKQIILLGRIRTYRPGERIMQVGDPSREMYILLRGVARNARDELGNGGGAEFQLTAGSVFGVVALVCGKTRIATAIAEEPCEVVSLDWSRIQRLARLHPRTAATLFQNLSRMIAERFQDSIQCKECPGPAPPGWNDAHDPNALRLEPVTAEGHPRRP